MITVNKEEKARGAYIDRSARFLSAGRGNRDVRMFKENEWGGGCTNKRSI